MRGRKTQTPKRSPLHQVSQLWRILSIGSAPAAARVNTPQVAAMRQPTGPQRVRRSATSLVLDNSTGSRIHRWIRRRTPRAWSVEPAAIPAAMSVGVSANPPARFQACPTRPLSTNEPRNTPGHRSAPNSNRAPMAMPEGGQMMVAYPGGVDRRRPSLPVMK